MEVQKKSKELPILVLLVGVPGAGKSTFANSLLVTDPKWVKISRDDFRHMFRNKWYDENIESLVTAAINPCIEKTLEKGFNVVLDNTHCDVKRLKETISKYTSKAKIVLKYVGEELTLNEIKAQNKNRVENKVVPEDIIDKMYKGFTFIVNNKQVFEDLIIAPEEPILLIQNEDLPKAIIVDIDGTIAHMNDKRGPFEWHNVHLDERDENIMNLLYTLAMTYNIVFMSGRDESCRELTTNWLKLNYAPTNIELYMRPRNNYEKDSIVKRRLFDENIKDKYYVEVVFDDRNSVVKAWREMGLKCLQVQEGDF